MNAQFKLYERGHHSYTKGKYSEAIGFFSEYLTKSTRDKTIDVDVFYLRALSYYKLNKFKEAIPDFEETMLRGHDNKGNIYWFMAKCHGETGDNEESIICYDNAIRELGHKTDALSKLYYERGLILLKSGMKDNAVHDFRYGLSYAPNSSELKAILDKLQVSHELPSSERPAAKTSSTPVKEPLTERVAKKETSPERVTVDDKAAKKVQPVESANTVVIPSTPTLADYYKNERRYALVIGVSSYGKEIGSLKNPLNDATDMAKELEASHFEVQLLTNATYGQIRAALMRFKEKLDGGDPENTVGLFYFAGHGLSYQDENYLVPVDASVQYEDDIPRYCFPIQRMVLNNMERSSTRMNIVILDACRNNPFPTVHRSLGGSGLGEMRRAKGTFIAYATAPGSVALDGTGRNGLYTQELLKAMKKPGLTIEQVFKEVRANVLRLSENKQNTWDSSNIVGEFHFKY